MKINWFPGHMTKALRQMQGEIKGVDIVVYMLDARAPSSCLNPKFAEVIGDKSVLYVLNKADLADEKKLDSRIVGVNERIIKMNSTASGAKTKITAILRELASSKIEKLEAKGVSPTIRAMVIGVPNSGKSTFINNMVGKTKAETGDKPGVTRAKVWLKVDKYLELLDTPGTLWPSFDSDEVACNLAFIGSIKSEVLDEVELGLALLKKLFKEYPQLIEERYGLTELGQDPLGEIAEVRKYMLKKGEPDYERTARAILDDFRKGRIGKITL